MDAADRFLTKLTGVVNQKKSARLTVEVFQDQLGTLGKIDFLAQGTLYQDIIESVSVKGPSTTIKTHHNVGGLQNLSFEP